MSVIKADKPLPTPPSEQVDVFRPSLLNKTLTDLKEKLENIITIKSGKSAEHVVPSLSSGTIYISVSEDEPICVIVSTLLCNDEFGSILAYQKQYHQTTCYLFVWKISLTVRELFP